jgi:SagB-type dehydrogenase family enzyme
LTVRILNFFHNWRPVAELQRHLDGRLPAPDTQALVEALAESGLLERSDRAAQTGASAMESWESWNPAAGFFHGLTRDVRYIDPRAGRRLLRRQARMSPMPAPVKRYEGAAAVKLPAPDIDGEFLDVLLSRRTFRRFGSGSVALDALGTLLGLTAGIQHWRELPGIGEVALKTYPSGGARHSLEFYVLSRRVDGLARGLYHYAPDRHVLERLPFGSRIPRVQEYLPRQHWFEPAAALIFMTAVFERVQWRYKFARAYRAVLAEAGHACQNFCLVATRLDLAPFCTMALADSRIERDLGVDGVRESVMYAAGIGARAKNGPGWLVPGQRIRRVRRNPAFVRGSTKEG